MLDQSNKTHVRSGNFEGVELTEAFAIYEKGTT
jgi:hypothetical protein